ncbi:MAG: glutamate-5-semialdehyde dehydrogenase [Lachnospiraceae bacterium]|nr:glutamate-5-semialdehyde dehydrogenase [Lachnospiraceae bacterium]
MKLQEMGHRAKEAAYQLQKLSTSDKNEALINAARALINDCAGILKANAKDITAAEAAGMHPGLVDRLRLDEARVKSMADGLKEIAALSDPVGEELESFIRPNGLNIKKVRVPMGVIGIIYESRPNVTADAFGLCFKAGNAVILKGGRDAINSNKAIANSLREALADCINNPNALQLIESTEREVTNEFMKLNRFVDVLIPRGGAGLIKAVVENSTIPVIETGTGNCHIYVDESADLSKAVPIIVNAKTQRIGVCNSCESLVVHKNILNALMMELIPALAPFNVELRGDEACMNTLAALAVDAFKDAGDNMKKMLTDVVRATEDDYAEEFLDYIMSVKTVSNINKAISHINLYNTKHSDAIIAEDKAVIECFKNEVDAACVYINTSTRFTDGFEFGFGAEIGISTQKLHARGPMGLKELTSYKYTIESDYLCRP